MGLVHEVFTRNDLEALAGTSGIGHVRYSTTGSSVIENAQPITCQSSIGDIALAHNGDIVNADLLRTELQKKGWGFMTSSDSEVIVRLLANEIAQSGDVERAMREFTNVLVGAYSLVLLIKDSVYAIRDPLAVRPLCVGEVDGAYVVASESVVFDTLGGKFIRDLKPGEIVKLSPDGFETFRIPHPTNTAHCMFEWVYFARPDSVLDNRLVYDARVRIGQELAREHHEGGRARESFRALALVEGLPRFGARGTHRGVIEQPSQFRRPALGEAAFAAMLPGVAGARIETRVGNRRLDTREANTREELG